jgi:hypothetical protein
VEVRKEEITSDLLIEQLVLRIKDNMILPAAIHVVAYVIAQMMDNVLRPDFDSIFKRQIRQKFDWNAE